MTEASMGRWLPKRAVEIADATARFTAILRDCYRYPSQVYAVRKKNGGQIAKPEMDRFMTVWAQAVLDSLGITLETKGTPTDKPVLLVGNHMSYIDIPLVAAATPTVFVAKKEIQSWPLIGYTCNCIDMVWVDRSSNASRRDAGAAVAPAILEKGHKVVIFPSGTTTMDEKVPWKRGAFRIAHAHGIEVQPFRIRYRPARRAAFLGKDLFAPHLWKLLVEGSVHATLEWGETRPITDVRQDCEAIQKWTMEGLSEAANE